MPRPALFLLVFCLTVPLIPAETLIRFEKIILETQFYSEGASFGDLNGDQHMDVVYGPFWFAGPDFQQRHTFYETTPFNINGYSNNFLAYVRDFNQDAHQDVLVLGFPGKAARLYLNPGEGVATKTAWKMHEVAAVVDNESPIFTDITGDGQPEIVCSQGGRFGYYAPGADVTQPWPWTPLTPDVGVKMFTHGLGVGDVNGDGKMDLLEAKRWWEQPLPGSPDSWAPHTFDLTGSGGAQMFTYDFNVDGRNDLVTALNAHQFGVAWFENKAGDKGANWQKHLIVGKEPHENPYGVRFSQPHAMALEDVDGDGIKDIITGKRYWAHNGRDPEELDPKVLYWFQTKRLPNGQAEFVPHLIDGDTGVGTQLTTGDLNGDGLLDVVVGNKHGCRVLLQRREEVSAERYTQFQPKKIYGPQSCQPGDYEAGQSAAEAVKNMVLPAGFKAELIAAEPDVVQPIAICWDERGRLWVAEGRSYPQRRAEGKGEDRILILSDEDGNGSYETKKIFMEKLNLVSGMELGFGGVWIGAAPNLLFIPDKDRNDQPDGPPQVLLDGWGFQDTHETLNSFIWGPDGWLYGCHGVFTHSKVGKPGTLETERIPINAGVWRYHPVRHEFEVFAHGTSNPWGLDYDEHGEFFVTACVIPHLFHIVSGGRYQRQAGQHFNPYTYEDIKTIADHSHYEGTIRDNRHLSDLRARVGAAVAADTHEAGGGHAHCGLAIYQGDNFPAEYRGSLIFGNLHGHRLVQDRVQPKGSSFTGMHRPDFLRSNDHWFIPVQQKSGPDGALYVTDWSDQQVCHLGSNAVEKWDRSNGRIYRVVYDQHKPWTGDLGKLNDEELMKLAVESNNVWTERTARRLLMERAASGKLADQGKPLETMLTLELETHAFKTEFTLRGLWALQAIAGLKDDSSVTFSGYKDEHIRAWGVRLSPGLASLQSLAEKDVSPRVRRELASALQRLPLDKRSDIALALLARKEDAADPVIPLLIWYGIEPLVASDPAMGLKLAAASKMEKVTGFICRRMTVTEAGRAALLGAISDMQDVPLREQRIGMLLEAARQTGKLPMPEHWTEMATKLRVDASPQLQAAVLELSALFGDADAIAIYRSALTNAQLPASQREAALQLLLQVRDPATAKVCQEIILTSTMSSALRRRAVQALAALRDPGNVPVLVSEYAKLSAEEKSDAISSLASTREGAVALVKAVEENSIPRDTLSPFLIRQMQSLKDAEVEALITKVYGTLNASKTDLPQRIAKWKAVLTPEKLKTADLAQGRMIFTATCGTCHQLNGEGASVGPDLTGSNRADLNYLLENVLDPNALIGKDYQLNLFSMHDGRVLSGIVKEESAAAYRLVMPGGIEFTLRKDEVKSREVSKFSTMPEGLFDALGEEPTLKLVAYLQNKASSQPPAAPANTPYKAPGALEGEDMKVLKITGGTVRPQTMTSFKNGRWSGGKQLWWTGAKAGDVLVLDMPVSKEGIYKFKTIFTTAKDYATVQVTRNERPLDGGREILFSNFYSPEVTTVELDHGRLKMEPGPNTLEIKITGADPKASPGLMVGLDCLIIEPGD